MAHEQSQLAANGGTHHQQPGCEGPGHCSRTRKYFLRRLARSEERQRTGIVLDEDVEGTVPNVGPLEKSQIPMPEIEAARSERIPRFGRKTLDGLRAAKSHLTERATRETIDGKTSG